MESPVPSAYTPGMNTASNRQMQGNRRVPEEASAEHATAETQSKRVAQTRERTRRGKHRGAGRIQDSSLGVLEQLETRRD